MRKLLLFLTAVIALAGFIPDRLWVDATILNTLETKKGQTTITLTQADCANSAICTGVGNRDIVIGSNYPQLQTLDGGGLTIDCGAQGHAFRFVNGTKVTVKNFTIRNCTGIGDVSQSGYGLGGAVHVFDGSPHLLSVKFEQNTAAKYGGAIFLHGESEAIIDKCHFEQNTALSGGAIFADASRFYTTDGKSIVIRGCTFLDNFAMNTAGSIFVRSPATIEDTTITWDDQIILVPNIGGGIYAEGDINMNGVILTNVFSNTRGGGIYIIVGDGDAADLTNVTVTGGSSDMGGGMYLDGLGVVNLKQCVIDTCSASQSTHMNGGGIAIDGANLVAIGTTWKNNNAESMGGGLYVFGMSNSIVLNGSTFEGNIAASSGGALYLDEAVVVDMEGCTFKNNNLTQNGPTSGYGGAVFFSSALSTITSRHTSFISNNAAFGGACYFMSHSGQCTVTSEFTTFNRNNAYRAGGAIYGLDPSTLETFKNTTWKDNTAACGASYSGQPSNLAKEKDLPAIIYAGSDESLSYKLTDDWGQIVTYEIKNSKLALSFQNTTAGVECTLIGNSIFDVNNGYISVTDVQLGGTLGKECVLQATAYLPTLMQPVGSAHSTVQLNEKCPAGSFYSMDSCHECPVETYNLDGVSGCKNCPDGAKCLGGTHVVSKDNYFKIIEGNKAKMYRCKVEDCSFGACDSICLSNDECKRGYESTLCGTCKHGYTKIRNTCRKCDGAKFYAIALLIVYIFAVIYLFGFLRPKSFNFLKIFFNYFQTMCLLVSFTYMWIFSLDLSQVVQAMTGDCLKPMDYFQQYLLSVLSPLIWAGAMIICVGISYVIHHIRSAKDTNMDDLATRGPRERPWYFWIFQTSLAILVFCHSPISFMILSYYPTREVDGKHYLVADLSVDTESDKYKNYLPIAIIATIVWVVAIPAALFFLLFKMWKELPKDLNENSFKKQVSGFLSYTIFFYATYNRRWVWWDAVMIFRRLVLIIVTLEWSGENVAVRVLLAVFVSLAIILIHFFVKPFNQRRVNKVESVSLLCLVVVAVIYEQVPTLDSLDTSDSTVRNTNKMFRAVIAVFFFAAVASFLFWLGTKIDRYCIRKKKKSDVEMDAPPDPSLGSTLLENEGGD